MTNTQIVFWGTRGSYPIASQQTIKVGGRTSCVSIEYGQHLIILDAGTGIIALGDDSRLQKYKQATILLSHLHHDHIMGIPFFKPIFDKEWSLHFYAGVAKPYGGLEEVLKTCFSPPYFPIEWEKFPSSCNYQDFSTNQSFTIQDITVETIALDHPGGACGYRLVLPNAKSVVYLTDTKHNDQSNIDFTKFCQDADLLIYDSTFTDEEFTEHPDWGHSTWREATRLATAANVKCLALFHHNPDHCDQQMKEILIQAQSKFANTILGTDGLEIFLK
jgi:ribonuclease BN (tRNA processing enzyme)